ncbi:hypothetical protein RIF29_41146 [Crotalaria pallida]|uniref:Probable magnesium transporter n=1 Tax=Crotalaria pallida TaxID=3830 RepID=A0AAN9HR90_CROPI
MYLVWATSCHVRLVSELCVPQIAAQGLVPVFLDGGVRPGTNVFKALALGASGIFFNFNCLNLEKSFDPCSRSHLAGQRKWRLFLLVRTTLVGGHDNNAALAHIILRERLHLFGILGCVLCVVGSTTIVLHAPQEREIESVTEVWDLAMEPAFLFYAALIITAAFVLIFHFIPLYGQTHILVYIGVCSLIGSLSVMSVKALGIAIKLTLSGMNQLIYPQTWIFTLVVAVCVLTQMNYLNKEGYEEDLVKKV